MNWLKVIGSVLEYVILPWLRARRMEKKAKQLEVVVSAVINGVEICSNMNKEDRKDIKKVIKEVAIATGVETKLQELVKKYTK
ncbi:MAG: hypothetical protein QME51_11160 [Planctomycetota bacterium]|nr:hypothetical protein [Planctomycetota bacterium]